MAVVSPYSGDKMEQSVKRIYKDSEPCYLRMCRTSDRIWSTDQETIYSNGGKRATILVTGGQIAANASEASKKLSKLKVAVDVIAVSNIKPLARSALRYEAYNTDLLITIEEHSKIGGLGSAVAEVLAGLKQHPPLVRLGTGDEYPDTAMSYEELLKANHLDVDGIVKEVLDALR
jgi:transketolase